MLQLTKQLVLREHTNQIQANHPAHIQMQDIIPILMHRLIRLNAPQEHMLVVLEQ